MVSQVMVRVAQSVQEAKGLQTLRFAFPESVRPGQFLMIWVPGVDEVPMSVSYIYGEKGITVKEIGVATMAMASLSPGDLIGVRGPYGNGFEIPTGRVLLAGGGAGLACVMPVADFIGDRSKVGILIGARTADELVFVERGRRLSDEVRVSTDDGTMGIKGTVIDLARRHLKEKRYDAVFGCGPERMLVSLLKLCHEQGIPCQLSLERYMKCGAGLCGSCVIDGQRVCAEGPVFDGDRLQNSSEFGRTKRDEAGLPIKL